MDFSSSLPNLQPRNELVSFLFWGPYGYWTQQGWVWIDLHHAVRVCVLYPFDPQWECGNQTISSMENDIGYKLTNSLWKNFPILIIHQSDPNTPSCLWRSHPGDARSAAPLNVHISLHQYLRDQWGWSSRGWRLEPSAMLLPRGPPTLDHRLWPRRQWPILGETGWKLGEHVGRCWKVPVWAWVYESTFKTQGPHIFGLLISLVSTDSINHQIWCNNRDPILTRTQFGVNGWYPKMVQNYWEKMCFTSGSW